MALVKVNNALYRQIFVNVYAWYRGEIRRHIALSRQPDLGAATRAVLLARAKSVALDCRSFHRQ